MKTNAAVFQMPGINFNLVLAGLVCLVFVLLIWINRSVLCRFMNSADEYSCYFFAQLLGSGKLWTVPPALPEFFQTPHIGIKDGKWFSVYPPGWPLLWSLGIRMGLRDVLNPLFAGLGVFFWSLYGLQIYGKKVILLAVSLLLISPFFLLTGASYYSHNTCFFLSGLFCYAFYRWQTKHSSLWALCAGLCLGYNLGTRYLTAAALAFPFGLFLGYELVKGRVQIKPFVFFVAALTVPLLLQLGYHQALTGRFWDFPNHYLQAHEKLGFIAGYTPLTALGYLWKRFFYLLDWTPPMALVFFLALWIQKPANVWDALNRISVISLPVFYLFYYSWGGNQYGPRYYFEGYFLLLILVAAFLKSMSGISKVFLRWGVGILIISFLSSGVILTRHFYYFNQVSRERGDLYQTVEREARKPALIFLKGFFGDLLVMSEEDAVRNDSAANAQLIYAHDRGAENIKLSVLYPGRNIYLAGYDRALKRTVLIESKLND